MADKVVYAIDTASVALSTGSTFTIHRGQKYSTALQVYREQPQWFSEDPLTGMDDAPVEQATATPGEKRNARRG
ncbi:MAG TPA: hypothetical protein VFC00_30695 [Micromonosporaceae bacterium]|nr:hypothetical protein [Micromonosporaceae bacterium]